MTRKNIDSLLKSAAQCAFIALATLMSSSLSAEDLSLEARQENRQGRFQELFPETSFAKSTLDKDVVALNDHSRVCRSRHQEDQVLEPLLKSLKGSLDRASTQDEDFKSFYVFYQNTKALLEGPEFPPAGICATLRAAHHGANEAHSYEAAALIHRVTYQTIIDYPHAFVKDPKTALARGLRIAREHTRNLDPANRRVLLKKSMSSLAWCRELVPDRILNEAMVGAGDASIIPDPSESAPVLEAASAAFALPGLSPKALTYHASLEMYEAATTDKGRYWFQRTVIDRIIHSGGLNEEETEAFTIAKYKAFRVPLGEGALIFRDLFRELLLREKLAANSGRI